MFKERTKKSHKMVFDRARVEVGGQEEGVQQEIRFAPRRSPILVSRSRARGVPGLGETVPGSRHNPSLLPH